VKTSKAAPQKAADCRFDMHSRNSATSLSRALLQCPHKPDLPRLNKVETEFLAVSLLLTKPSAHLNLSLLAQAADRGSHGHRGSGVEDVCAPSLDLLAALALPDAHSAALHRVLAAEAAEVLGVLADLDLLDLLTQGGTITGTVLAHNANLLRAL